MLRAVHGIFALVVLGAGAGDAAAQFRAPAVAVYIPAGIGGGYDAYARLASRHLGRFLPGNPAIVPRNMPGAGGVIVANYLYNVAPKDGSAIALFMAGAPFEPLFGNTQAKYDTLQFNWIMSLNRLVNIGIFWHESPVRTMQDFLSQEILVGSSGGGDSSTEAYPNLLNLLAGTKFKVVTGYKGNGEAMLAMERHEVHGIVGTELSSLRATRPDWIRDKKVRIVVQIGLSQSDDLPGVPSGLDLIKDAEGRRVFELLLARQEYGRPFALPPGTPPDVRCGVPAGLRGHGQGRGVPKDAEKMRADIIVGTGEEVSGLFAKTYGSPKPLVERAIATFKSASGKR